MARTKKQRAAARCEWTLADEDSGQWEGSCGITWEFINDGPVENKVNYCPRCGSPLKVSKKP